MADQGPYEVRFRFTLGAKLGIFLSVVLLLGSVPAQSGSAEIASLVVLFVLTILPALTGATSRRIVFRADEAGIVLGAGRADGKLLKQQEAVFVSWAEIESIVVYRRSAALRIRPAECIALQRERQRQGTAAVLHPSSEPARGSPVPGVSAELTRTIDGWRLDRARLTAIAGAYAPGVAVLAFDAAPVPSVS